MEIKQKIMKETEVSITPKFNIWDVVFCTTDNKNETRIMKIQSIIILDWQIKYYTSCWFDTHYYIEETLNKYL